MKKMILVAVVLLVLAVWGIPSMLRAFNTIAEGGAIGVATGSTLMGEEIKQLFMSQGNYNELTTELVMKAELGYEQWIVGDHMEHPWGGRVEVVQTAPRTFQIQFLDFPQDACASIGQLKSSWKSVECDGKDMNITFQ